MGVQESHPDMPFKAYKKINGKEHQYYFKTREEAEARQAKLDALAKLKAKKVFRDNGSMRGVVVKRIDRLGRSSIIAAKVQIGVFCRSEIKYNGNFEDFWVKCRDKWKNGYNLTTADVADYNSELSVAKSIMMKQIGELERCMR